MNVENKYFRFRILLVGALFLISFVLIAAKAIDLQIYRSPWLSQMASGQYQHSLTKSGKRGNIYDRNHRQMAVSIHVNSIAAYPARLKETKVTAKVLANILKLDADKIKRKLAANKPFVWIKRQTTAKETKAVKDLQIPGIDFVTEYNRFYPHTTLAAQALGFTGLDGEGLEGIEFYYNQHLKGPNKNFTVFKDALGNKINADPNHSINSRGHDLILTVDSNIQYITEKALQEVVDQYSALSALAIVMQPRTGEILSIAHYPLINPNAYTQFSKSLWRNRAVADSFEPGSTMKIFSAAAALEDGRTTANSLFYCENGAYRIGKNVVHDIHKRGWLSLQQIVKFSSNIGAVKVGEKVGAKTLYQTLRNFGFGRKTGVDFPGETPGRLSNYSYWSKIDTGAISFGHGVSVSAIQMIAAVSAIANDGLLMKPYIVKQIVNQNGQSVKRFEPQKIRRAVSAQTAKIIKNIMKTVITEGGTGVNAALDGYSVGGKTGTSRKLDESGQYSRKNHTASFIGFTPADDPEIAILVVVDEPKGKYYGGIVAAPVFKQIAQQTLNYLNVPPDGGTTKFRVLLNREAKG